MTGTSCFISPHYWEIHHPNWRTLIFSTDVGLETKRGYRACQPVCRLLTGSSKSPVDHPDEMFKWDVDGERSRGKRMVLLKSLGGIYTRWCPGTDATSLFGMHMFHGEGLCFKCHSRHMSWVETPHAEKFFPVEPFWKNLDVRCLTIHIPMFYDETFTFAGEDVFSSLLHAMIMCPSPDFSGKNYAIFCAQTLMKTIP